MRKILLLMLILGSFLFCKSQQYYCGTDKVMLTAKTNNPEYKAQLELTEQIIQNNQQLIRNSETGRITASATIPVVVHILLSGNATADARFPTDAEVQNTISYMNEVFAGTYAGQIPAVGQTTPTDLDIKFALARRTPTCAATNGIERIAVATSGWSLAATYVANGIGSMSGITDNDVATRFKWDNTKYYNVYLTYKLDGDEGITPGVPFTAGYAYLPNTNPFNFDGTYMLGKEFRSGNTVLVHELGHAFSLYHPFEGSANSASCPTNTTCSTQGDLVCDTDPISNNVTGGILSFACRTGANACAGGNPYTVNTESNIMSYTNCPNLFTPGQKTRAQAALLLPSRTTLVSSNTITPCNNEVNFELGTDVVLEANKNTTATCSTYRDYVYLMTLGVAPTQSTTVTISKAGTATEGNDYEFTTAANFSTTTNTITFPVGSTAPKSFRVRVYDDKNVETDETIVFNFMLNNGGGNIVMGTIAPSLTVTIKSDDALPGTATRTVITGDGALTHGLSAGSSSLFMNFSRRIVQYIIPRTYLNEMGITGATTIKELGINILTKASTAPYLDFTIRLGHTSSTNISSTITGLTQVYNSPSYSSAAGTNMFPFSTNFNWNGTSNLVVSICYGTSSNTLPGGQDIIDYTSSRNTITNSAAYNNAAADWSSAGRNDDAGGTSGCAGNIATLSVAIPHFIYVLAQPTVVSNVAGSTSNQFVGASGNEYFYDASGNILAQLSNVSQSLGCVEAKVEEAGNGTIPYGSNVDMTPGKRTRKVWKITPSQNNTSATYKVKLYISNTELGGETPAGLKIIKSTAATTAAFALANTTSEATTVVTDAGNGWHTYEATFGGFSFFFLGGNNVVVPAKWLAYQAHLNTTQNPVITWTVQESDVEKYEIQWSSNGVDFTTIGTVTSRGNGDNSYTFVHSTQLVNIAYYKIKQIGLNNTAYTGVMKLNANKSKFVEAYPNPSFGNLMVRSSSVGNIVVSNTAGKVVLKAKIVNGIINLDVNKLSAGVYIIHNDFGAVPFKFIKQ